MKPKEKSAETVKEIADVLRCPLCHHPMKVFALKSLVCKNNHTFDFAKQGYVNMMTRPSRSHYDKMLFEARQKIIMESNLYELLHKKISEVIEEYLEGSHDPTIILDAGCGEGSHLQRILKECNDNTMTGIGLDISKEGIVMAAKHYRTPVWLVGDLANSPLASQSCHYILNILSPANYQEFQRMMVPGGLMIKVVPRRNYLNELREVLFDDTDKKTYENNDTVSLFKQHFHLMDHFTINYTKSLSQIALKDLMQMSPLAWHAKQHNVDAVLNHCLPEVTIDLDILIGTNK
ncbi:putative RNA methyltransferase [Shouchella shacheensis]|uniref:putative RNA methyltransferase n=1 Tax=Shouchella shacheensis TaxID=1649580 RepID=UPI00073FC00B|nr:methyltransferase domain-containing protein [Shouchella shacheensis]